MIPKMFHEIYFCEYPRKIATKNKRHMAVHDISRVSQELYKDAPIEIFQECFLTTILIRKLLVPCRKFLKYSGTSHSAIFSHVVKSQWELQQMSASSTHVYS